MKARYSIAARLAEGGAFQTVGVLVLGKKLVFVATNEKEFAAYGAQIEWAAENHKENGVSLEQIFEYYSDRDFGPVESWSKPATKTGDNERAIGEEILKEAEFVER